MPTVEELFNTRRWCYYIPRSGFVEGRGYRVSIVFEGETGHYPTGGDGKEPWFWGDTYEEAEEAAARQNSDQLGLSATDIATIVKSAMRGPGMSSKPNRTFRDPSHHKTLSPRSGKR